MTFYASGIFIAIVGLRPINAFGVKVDLAHLLLINPFAALLEQARHVFISPSYPSAASAIGGTAMLLIPIGIGVIALVGGFLLFDRQAPRVAEQLRADLRRVRERTTGHSPSLSSARACTSANAPWSIPPAGWFRISWTFAPRRHPGR